MSASPAVRAIVLDIEGTTTPLGFVYDVLFPYARRHLRSFLETPPDPVAVADPVGRLHQEWAAECGGDQAAGRWEVASYVERLMDLDRKSPGLKLLQGLIWQEGYRRGELKGEVYPDVVTALKRWRDRHIGVATYSSGSELAQRLLLGSTAGGDLTPLVARFFDTAVGAKAAVDSYRRIAGELGCPVDRMLFVSDVTSELEAARAAGCQTRLCVRPGNRPQPPNRFPVIQTFDDIG